MCGITGWLDWENDLTRREAVIKKMMGTLQPRGPDDSGTWFSQRLAFGHRRLSVVDPAGGAQPMVRHRGDNTYVICYNGELYNTPELRTVLEKRGYHFQGHSDTEVLLCSYMQWGPQCIERLNGIFAVAIWDEAEQTLLLARDRLGVKPLFYYTQHNMLVFGSEIKALLVHPDIKATIGEEGLAEVLLMAPARTPGHGVFEGIREVCPGYLLIINRQGIRSKKYWYLQSKPHLDDLETTATKLRTLLSDAVERQLVSDVPVCTLLSGGLDSSILTALAANSYFERGLGPLHTYSVEYEDNDRYFQTSLFQPNRDDPWVKRVSDQLRTCHHSVIITIQELVSALANAVMARDLPGQADIDSSLYLFCCEIKKGATVALSGECADEIFGGYPWFNDSELQREMFPWVRHLDQRVSLWKNSLFKSFKPQEYIRQRYAQTIAEVPRLDGESPLEARRREMFYLNMNWFMTSLLDRKDRMSMATGLEVRVPYADHLLVEYIWNIPWEMKMHGGIPKGILRYSMKDILPGDVLYRAKSPYPKTHHPDYTRAVQTWLTDILTNPASPIHSVINKSAVRKILASPGDVFDKPFFGQLMQGPQMMAYLIQLNTWLEKYKVQIKC